MTANFINTIAAALVITGRVVPVISLTYGLPTPTNWLLAGVPVSVVAIGIAAQGARSVA